jgi:aspartokinase/homoserine dehydrogenase 1
VISSLRDLLDTGDEVRAIEGIFSGTLAYLFNAFDGSTPFSELVLDARMRAASPNRTRAMICPAWMSPASW